MLSIPRSAGVIAAVDLGATSIEVALTKLGGRYWSAAASPQISSVINTAEQAMEVIERIDSPACGILLDTFHMNIEERDPEEAIRSVGPRLAHFHACANDRGAPGNDHMNWAAISTALAEVRYTGPVCIESFTSENESIATAAAIWRPLAPTQDEIATSGLAFLRGVLNEPENQ